MNSYCIGIAYSTGYFSNDAKKKYLVVRNVDKWYPEQFENQNKVFVIHKKDGSMTYGIKVRDIHELPDLENIECINDFCRAYIEIHGIIDKTKVKNHGKIITRFRLRIYGNEEIVLYLNKVLPAKEKKIQRLTASSGGYTGNTTSIVFQAKSEIEDILRWIDGPQKNETTWVKWYGILMNNE